MDDPRWPQPLLDLTAIDWLIVGGESGPHHRAMRMEWVQDLPNLCAATGALFFFEQDSAPRPGQRGRFADEQAWPRQMPTSLATVA
jgi:protein gp37